jgi:hypothetical protein
MSIAAVTTVTLPEGTLAQLERSAEAEQRSLDELLTEVLKRYLEGRSWAELVAYGRKQGESVGIIGRGHR